MSSSKNIIIKEYEKTKPGVLNSKDILEIEKLNNLSGGQIFEIHANNRIKAKQFVGIVKVNNKNIQVLPKIFGDDTHFIIKNLLFMLQYTNKLNIKESDIAKLGKVESLFEVFIYIFARELVELLKKDFKKHYNDVEENSSFLKGKLLFSKHLKYNLFDKSKFYIGYEKMDQNFLLNIFLHSCCKKLLKVTNSKVNYKLLSKCIFILKDIDTRVFHTTKELDTISFKKENIKYTNVFSLAKMLYFGNSPDFSSSIQNNYSLLFDMNLLFEEFIAEFLKKYKSEIHTDIQTVNSQVASKFVFLEKKFTLRPDILIEFSNNKKLIIDTKYKKLHNDKTHNGVASQDIYQMLTYGMRYFSDDSLQKDIILLYPDYDGYDYNKEYVSQENISISIRTISMAYDLSKCYGRDLLKKELQNIIEKYYVK